jgi:MYXO-CTERM domain-containing protein
MSLPLLVLSLLPPALAAGAAPSAEAGLGVLAYVGDTVVLNGTGSSDPEGDNLTYVWTQVQGAAVEIEGATTAEPSFVIEAPGAYGFALVVNDGTTDSLPDEVVFYAPDRELTPDGESAGCATASGSAPAWSALGLAAALFAVRRRSSAKTNA